jgi:hypothetical protein
MDYAVGKIAVWWKSWMPFEIIIGAYSESNYFCFKPFKILKQQL